MSMKVKGIEQMSSEEEIIIVNKIQHLQILETLHHRAFRGIRIYMLATGKLYHRRRVDGGIEASTL